MFAPPAMLESKPAAIAWGFQPETFADAPPDFVIGEMGSWWIECLVAGERQSFC